MIIYYTSELPKEGWIQRCFLCSHCTSHTIEYIETLTKNKHTVYLCKHCLKQHSNKIISNKISIPLSQKILRYISENTLEPYKVPIIPINPPQLSFNRGEPSKPPIYPIQKNDSTPPKIKDIKNQVLNDVKNQVLNDVKLDIGIEPVSPTEKMLSLV